MICEKLFSKKLFEDKKILILPFGGGEDIESFLNIDYFDNSNRDLFLLIDSDKHLNNQDKQNQRVEDFKKNKKKGQAYILSKSYINFFVLLTFFYE